MINRILLALFYVLFWSVEARSEIENEVKRGIFPYMAILYYPDESVVDATGARFQHAAILIKPEWLLSSAIDHSVMDNEPLGFPRKTLLAKMGALTVDSKFTLNEDEDEQEREVIQIVKPNNHNMKQWWSTDITLLQTLLPFKLSATVAPTNINPKQVYNDKKCIILVYAKKAENVTEDKVLMQMGVEMIPTSAGSCGPYFNESTMTCAAPGEDFSSYDPEFCRGNSGGPLLCEGEVMALQTYIENNCKQPYLYQLLSSWDTYIKCGVDQKCNVEPSCNVCLAVNKDMPITEIPMAEIPISVPEISIPVTETSTSETSTSETSTSEILTAVLSKDENGTNETVMEANLTRLIPIEGIDDTVSETTMSAITSTEQANFSIIEQKEISSLEQTKTEESETSSLADEKTEATSPPEQKEPSIETSIDSSPTEQKEPPESERNEMSPISSLPSYPSPLVPEMRAFSSDQNETPTKTFITVETETSSPTPNTTINKTFYDLPLRHIPRRKITGRNSMGSGGITVSKYILPIVILVNFI